MIHKYTTKKENVFGVKCQLALIYANRFGSQNILIFPSYLRPVAWVSSGRGKRRAYQQGINFQNKSSLVN